MCERVCLPHVVDSGVRWGVILSGVLFKCRAVCMCVRLRPFIQDMGTFLLADEESSLVHQVHEVSFVEESVYMESSVDPFVSVRDR